MVGGLLKFILIRIQKLSYVAYQLPSLVISLQYEFYLVGHLLRWILINFRPLQLPPRSHMNLPGGASLIDCTRLSDTIPMPAHSFQIPQLQCDFR